MIKASTEHPFLLAAYRLLLAAVIMLPFFLRDLRVHRAAYSWRELRQTLLPGFALAAHFLTWNIGARMTSAANGSVIINLVPIASPFLLYFVASEVVTSREMLGTILTLGGALLLSFSDLQVSAETFTGDWLCFVSMLLFAWYLVLGRSNRGQLTVLLYVVPLYAVAGVFCLAAALFVTSPLKSYSAHDLLLTLGLTLIPTIIGHSLLNYSMRHFRGQFVSLMTLTQFIPSAIMAYFWLNETPGWTFYPAAAIALSGATLAVFSHANGKRQA